MVNIQDTIADAANPGLFGGYDYRNHHYVGYFYDYNEWSRAINLRSFTGKPVVGRGVGYAFYCTPKSMNDSVGANFQVYGDIVGRTAPIFAYRNTGAREISFDIVLVVDGMAIADEFRLQEIVNFLRSFLYPEYKTVGNNMAPPHLLGLDFGDFIHTKGILSNLNVSWEGPYTPETNFPMVASLDIKLTEVLNRSIDMNEVRAGTWGVESSGIASYNRGI